MDFITHQYQQMTPEEQNDFLQLIQAQRIKFTPPPTETLQERVEWALKPWPNGLTYTGISKQEREQAKIQETEFGQRVIGKNVKQWTTALGEGLVYDVLTTQGYHPRKPAIKSGVLPDWETDEFMVEVKTRTWTTTGTAGEKVLGTMYKYAEVPRIYNKPLKIICVGYQEWENTHGKLSNRIFGTLSEEKQRFLELAKSLNIEYVPFSTFYQSSK